MSAKKHVYNITVELFNFFFQVQDWCIYHMNIIYNPSYDDAHIKPYEDRRQFN